jgi:hypothetical protein
MITAFTIRPRTLVGIKTPTLDLTGVDTEFYLRYRCSFSEPLAAQQSNAPAIPNDIKIITTIKTTTF